MKARLGDRSTVPHLTVDRNGAGVVPTHGGDPGVSRALNDVRREDTSERIRRAALRVVVAGSRATIVFQDILSAHDTQTGCRETRKIDRITKHGEIVYRTVCTGPWKKVTARDRVSPITVPAKEARAIKPGQVVEAIANRKSRAGAVLFVYPPEKKSDSRGRRDAKPLPIRSFRVAPTGTTPIGRSFDAVNRKLRAEVRSSSR